MAPVAEPPVLHVTYYADDFRLNIKQADVEVLAHWIFVGEILVGEVGINDDDGGRVFIIAVGEEAATLNGDVQGGLVSRIHAIKEREGHIVFVGGLGLAFEPERHFGIAAHGQGSANQGGGLNSGDGSQLAEAFAVV